MTDKKKALNLGASVSNCDVVATVASWWFFPRWAQIPLRILFTNPGPS